MTSSSVRHGRFSYPNFKAFFYAYAGNGIESSGGDKILLELLKSWLNAGYPVSIHTTTAGERLCRNYGLQGAMYKTVDMRQNHLPFPLLYSYKILRGTIDALKLKIGEQPTVVYSASDFLPDSFPAFIIKKRKEGARWVAGFYLFAPNPFGKHSDAAYGGGKVKTSLRTLAYHLSQIFVYKLIVRNADFVLVANELDRRIFANEGFPASRIKAIYGGVDVQAIEATRSSGTMYDGCFVGRLHPQKGTLELLRVWRIVCNEIPHARLAVIGSGPLETQMKQEIHKLDLQDEVDMLGWVEGKWKYEILKSSRVFLHTPVRDTGGMAAAEGMACGLPVVGFDLPGYEFAYPQGMLKAPVGDVHAFAGLVIELLHNETLWRRVSAEALDSSLKWDWNVKSKEVLKEIESLII
jgi:glycosyltransferase involved in cell wall biosynthesis